MDDNALPEEDELLDRCLEFVRLITHIGLKNERDALFQFIMNTSRIRAEEELRLVGYTSYPLIQEVAPKKRLMNQNRIYTLEQERYVNLVLKSKRDKTKTTTYRK